MTLPTSFSRSLAQGLATLLATLSLGCGQNDPNIGKVSGVVTLDGKPLPNARVVFHPKAGGSPSFGLTDSQGRYRLDYTRDLRGALPGEHAVSISTYAGGDADADPPIAASLEMVPAKYNLQTSLTASVEKGSNAIDFALDRQGEVLSPEQFVAKLQRSRLR